MFLFRLKPKKIINLRRYNKSIEFESTKGRKRILSKNIKKQIVNKYK